MQTGFSKTRKRNKARHKLLGMPKTAYFCVHFKYLIFCHTLGLVRRHTWIACETCSSDHLSRPRRPAPGFPILAAQLCSCPPTCRAQPGGLTQDPLTSCAGHGQPCSPLQQLGDLCLLHSFIFNRRRARGTPPGAHFLGPIPTCASGLRADAPLPFVGDAASEFSCLLTLKKKKKRMFWSLMGKSQDI